MALSVLQHFTLRYSLIAGSSTKTLTITTLVPMLTIITPDLYTSMIQSKTTRAKGSLKVYHFEKVFDEQKSLT